LEAVDFLPFKALADVSLGMTAHLLYESIDAESPGTQSSAVINGIIRDEIGFDGCLMSDDISMKALGGDVSSRSTKIWDAGCDIVLHCNGDMSEMQAVADAAPVLAGRSLERCNTALAGYKPLEKGFDADEAWAEFQSLTGWAGV
jgi:beta-N-acetylhexosaminidase